MENWNVAKKTVIVSLIIFFALVAPSVVLAHRMAEDIINKAEQAANREISHAQESGKILIEKAEKATDKEISHAQESGKTLIEKAEKAADDAHKKFCGKNFNPLC